MATFNMVLKTYKKHLTNPIQIFFSRKLHFWLRFVPKLLHTTWYITILILNSSTPTQLLHTFFLNGKNKNGKETLPNSDLLEIGDRNLVLQTGFRFRFGFHYFVIFIFYSLQVVHVHPSK